MKKFFLLAAAVVAAMTINAQEPQVKVLNEVANYIDFQALYEADASIVATVPTSTEFVTLPNGSVLKGFQKSDGSEAANSWNVKESYNTTMPTPEWGAVDSLKAGTMFRAASGSSIELGAFKTSADGKLVVYFQPNGDSERGVSVSILGGEPVECAKSGLKIGGIRPAYAAEFDLPKDNYDAGDVVIKLIVNTSNIFGVRIDCLGEEQGIEELLAAPKASKVVYNGQVVVVKGGRMFNLLGAEIAK